MKKAIKMKKMTKAIKLITASMLVLAVGILPAAAVGADADAGINTVRKFTPVIDGVIDGEYLSSFRIDHEWPEERTLENYWGYGKYAFEYETDENGNPALDENGGVIYTDKTAYGWDAQASSYFLWDDESLYIAISVTDDDYGCIDDEHYDIALENVGLSVYAEFGPYFQDSVALSLSYGDQSASILLTRDGRALCKILPAYVEEDNWCDVVPWLSIKEATAESYYAASETEDGYVLELCLKVREDMRAEMLRDGAAFDLDAVSVNDSPSDAEYFTISDITMQDWYRPDDSWLFKDIMRLGARYKTEDSSLTLTLSDGAAFELPPYDLNADGAVEAGDLTRLMRVIAGDGAVIAAQSADINGDGAVDVKDLTRLMKQLAEA